jgi:hypothetical protein
LFDAMLPDGSRLHVTIPDITRQHWSVKTGERIPLAFSMQIRSGGRRALLPPHAHRHSRALSTRSVWGRALDSGSPL